MAGRQSQRQRPVQALRWDRFTDADGLIYYHVTVGDIRYRIVATRPGWGRRWTLHQQPKGASVWGRRQGVQFFPPEWQFVAGPARLREIKAIARARRSRDR